MGGGLGPGCGRKANTPRGRRPGMGMNWESEREMRRDVEENRELYDALADKPDESEDE